MSHSERRIIVIQKRTHFMKLQTLGQTPNHLTWKIWQFANDLGLLADILSVSTGGKIDQIAGEILQKYFEPGSGCAFEIDEFADFVNACLQSRRTEAKIIGGSEHARHGSAAVIGDSGHGIIFRFFKKKSRQPFFAFHGRFTPNGKLKTIMLEKA